MSALSRWQQQHTFRCLIAPLKKAIIGLIYLEALKSVFFAAAAQWQRQRLVWGKNNLKAIRTEYLSGRSLCFRVINKFAYQLIQNIIRIHAFDANLISSLNRHMTWSKNNWDDNQTSSSANTVAVAFFVDKFAIIIFQFVSCSQPQRKYWVITCLLIGQLEACDSELLTRVRVRYADCRY